MRPARSSDGRAPDGELAGNVQQPPAGVAEAEHHRPFGEDLDLLEWSQDEADVAAGTRALGVAEVRPRTRMHQRVGPLRQLRPPAHVNHPYQLALPVDEEERVHAIAKTVKSLDRREAGIEGRRSLAILAVRRGRVVGSSQQKRAGRHATVLIRRQRGHSESLERRRYPVVIDRVEIIGDDQVLGQILKAVDPMRQLLVEKSAEAEVDRRHDHLDHSALGGQERHRISRQE